jgi:tetratricopeptide (TPR) repeat protein
MQAPVLAGRAALLAAAALLTTALFFGDGTSDGRLFWIGALAVVAAAVIAAAGGLPVPRGAGALALGLLTALIAWVGLTIWWSIAPDLSWAAFDRLLAYGAIALLGLLAARAPQPARTAAAGLALLLGLVLAWALLGKVIPSLFPDGARVARLRNPVGYWNSLALVAATAVPFGLWAACSRRFHPAARASGALLVYLAELVVVLTYSRAGIAVAAVAALAWLAIERDRLEALATLVLATPVAGLVALWAFSRPALTDDLQPYSDRVNDGAWFGVLLCVGAAVVCVLAYLAAGVELEPERRRSLTRALGVLVAVVGVVAVVVVAVSKSGQILGEFRGAKSAEVSQNPNRLADLSSSNRWRWWQEAWQLFTDAPAGGHGAATFEVARRGIRTGSIVTTEPHDLPLQFLAETGVVGFLVLLGLIGTGAAAAVTAVRRVEAAERMAATALALAAGTFVLHSLVDIHWEFVAVGAPAFFSLGVLVGLGASPPAARLRPAWAGAVAVVAVGVLYSLTAPYASGRLVDSAYVAIARGEDAFARGQMAAARKDVAAALADGRSARWLDPLATDPLQALGDAESARPDDGAALRYYRDAVNLQPKNSSTWYALGSFEFFTGRFRAALHDLDRAYGLDPYGPAGRPGGLLDQARAKVEGR